MNGASTEPSADDQATHQQQHENPNLRSNGGLTS
jgi:hypothetical protein